MFINFWTKYFFNYDTKVKKSILTFGFFQLYYVSIYRALIINSYYCYFIELNRKIASALPVLGVRFVKREKYFNG